MEVDRRSGLNQIKNLRAQARIVVYRWAVEVLTESLANREDVLSQAVPIEVSSHVSEISFSKAFAGPSGNFSFTLENDRDWKELIKPGQWCLIYMSQNGDLAPADSVIRPRLNSLLPIQNKLRCVGYIERVSAVGQTGERGELDVVYRVTGRDFGCIYENTKIWHDFFQSEQSLLKALQAKLDIRDLQTLDKMLEIIHQFLFSPLDLNLKPNQLKEVLGLGGLGIQWLLPTSMLKALDMKPRGSRPSFYGNLGNLLNFRPTVAGKPVENPVTFLEGDAWSILKALSIEPFHELFPELTNDGKLQLTFRPRPWKIQSAGYKLVRDNVLSLNDLARNEDTVVNIPALDIISFDVGEDNHSRYNHFLIAVETATYSMYNNTSELQRTTSFTGRKFPNAQKSSIKRHGFRPKHEIVNSLTQLNEKSDGRPDERLLVQYNELMFDYWNNAVFFESGSVSKIGSNDVRLGKVIKFDKNVPYNADKIFYIEGYEDSWIVGKERGEGTWTQTIQLTRGIASGVFRDEGNPADRLQSFVQTGEYTRANNNRGEN